jgi:hypothetical protein
VQHYANVVLDYIGRVDQQKREIRELKLALVTARILEPFDAFPEIKPEEEVIEDDQVPLPDEDDQVTYIFPKDPEDPQSIEDELRGLLAQAAYGTATFNDSEDG